MLEYMLVNHWRDPKPGIITNVRCFLCTLARLEDCC